MEKKGTVKFYNATKGFGFITPEDSEAKDIFVHASGIEGQEIVDGDQVTYIEGEGKKGPMATEVRVAN